MHVKAVHNSSICLIYRHRQVNLHSVLGEQSRPLTFCRFSFPSVAWSRHLCVLTLSVYAAHCIWHHVYHVYHSIEWKTPFKCQHIIYICIQKSIYSLMWVTDINVHFYSSRYVIVTKLTVRHGAQTCCRLSIHFNRSNAGICLYKPPSKHKTLNQCWINVGPTS